MRVASVSVLLDVFHISSLNAGKLYYPYPTIKDDVQVRPQYIPASNTFPAYDTSAYPWSIDDGSAYYHYPNHKHIGSTMPCPKKGHTTRKPYTTPEVTTTTTTTTTPRPTPHVVHALKVDHHKANAKGSVVNIKPTYKELELVLSQL